MLTFEVPIQQNGQTHSNNSSAVAAVDNFFKYVWPFCGVGASRVKVSQTVIVIFLKIFIYNARPKFSPLKTFSSTKQNYTQFCRVVIQPFRYDSR